MFDFQNWDTDSVHQLAIDVLFQLGTNQRRLKMQYKSFEVNFRAYVNFENDETPRITANEININSFLVCSLVCGFKMELDCLNLQFKCDFYQSTKHLGVWNGVSDTINQAEVNIRFVNEAALNKFLMESV